MRHDLNSTRSQPNEQITDPRTRPRSPLSGPLPPAPMSRLHRRNLVGFGQKSGIYFALNPDSRALMWSTMVGRGGTIGGIEWGSATDGRRIYAAITNSHKPYPLIIALCLPSFYC